MCSYNKIILCISIFCITILGQFCTPINGLKHHFHIKNAPSLLGPIGEPFGFTTGGIYEINLYNYNVYSKTKHGKDIVSTKEIQSTQYNGGFFLKKFNNNDEFYTYMDVLSSNHSICSYQSILNEILADNTGDDSVPFDDDSSKEYEKYVDMQQLLKSASNGILLNAFDSGDSGVGVSSSSSSSSTPSTFYNNNDQHGIDHDHDTDHEPINTTIKYKFQSGEDGLYYLIYQVCPFNPNIVSRFHIDFHFLNFDAFGNKSYLSAGEVHLPLMYLFFTISYSICFCLWVYNILEIVRGRLGIFVSKDTLLLQQRRQLSTGSTTPSVLSRNDIPVVYTIHYLMTLLVLLKGLSVFLESVRYYKIQVTGHADFLSFIYYTISLIKGTFLFTVILLIGTGWSTVKSTLNVREKYIFTIVLLLQVLNNIAIIILSQETFGELWYSRWSSIMHFIDLVCCCIIIIPIVWQVNELERSVGITDNNNDNNQESTSSSNTNGTSTRSASSTAVVLAGEVGEKEEALHRLRQFRTFYIIVIVYLYSTRVFVFLFSSDLNYKHTWIQQLIIELITLLFYVTVGFIFKPIPDSGYNTNKKQQQLRQSDDSDTTIQEEELELINRK